VEIGRAFWTLFRYLKSINCDKQVILLFSVNPFNVTIFHKVLYGIIAIFQFSQNIFLEGYVCILYSDERPPEPPPVTVDYYLICICVVLNINLIGKPTRPPLLSDQIGQGARVFVITHKISIQIYSAEFITNFSLFE
jgi:hypothetical protein